MGEPFKLAVRAVIEDEQGRCLLLRRSPLSVHFPGQWEWPGGKLDPGEDFASATRRETLEETGLHVELCALAGAHQSDLAGVHEIALCMEVEVTGGVLRLSDEHVEFAWVPWENVKNWDLGDNMRSFVLEHAQRKAATQ